MAYTNEEYQTYLKVRHELLLEDAREFLRAKLEDADDRNVGIDDISEEEFEKYDFEYLVAEYERREDCNVSFNDTWESVVSDYMADFEFEEA